MLLMRLVVVSFPAISNRIQKPRSSQSWSDSPSISASTSAVIRSSAAWARRVAAIWPKYATISWVFCMRSSTDIEIREEMKVSDQCLKVT